MSRELEVYLVASQWHAIRLKCLPALPSYLRCSAMYIIDSLGRIDRQCQAMRRSSAAHGLLHIVPCYCTQYATRNMGVVQMEHRAPTMTSWLALGSDNCCGTICAGQLPVRRTRARWHGKSLRLIMDFISRCRFPSSTLPVVRVGDCSRRTKVALRRIFSWADKERRSRVKHEQRFHMAAYGRCWGMGLSALRRRILVRASGRCTESGWRVCHLRLVSVAEA